MSCFAPALSGPQPGSSRREVLQVTREMPGRDDGVHECGDLLPPVTDGVALAFVHQRVAVRAERVRRIPASQAALPVATGSQTIAARAIERRWPVGSASRNAPPGSSR